MADLGVRRICSNYKRCTWVYFVYLTAPESTLGDLRGAYVPIKGTFFVTVANIFVVSFAALVECELGAFTGKFLALGN